MSNVTIEKLVVEVDRNLFYPRRVDNGTMSLNLIDSMVEMTFENVLVPALKADEEKLLLTIWGAAILGNKDSNDIFIKPPVKFSKELSKEPELFDGYITLDICREGGPRLLEYVGGYAPAVIVKSNPVTSEILEVECKTIERGNYRLGIMDLSGRTTILREWAVTANSSERLFNFEFPIQNYPNGSYLLIMYAPTRKFSTRFVISR